MLSFNHLLNLTVANVKLTEIKFVSGCTLLKSLNLSFNRIRDVSPLAALTQLVHLDISHNKVIDISPVNGLLQLQVFRFHKNLVQNIQFIKSMANLSDLWMSNNEIDWTELIHLSQLHQLAHISIAKNTCEAKAKYIEFLLAICPSILTINAVTAISCLPATGAHTEKNWYNPSDFLKTTDGRIM